MLQRSKQADRLDRLAQPHVVGQAGAEFVLVEKGEPSVAELLVVPQLCAEPGGGALGKGLEVLQAVQDVLVLRRQLQLCAEPAQGQAVEDVQPGDAHDFTLFFVGLGPSLSQTGQNRQCLTARFIEQVQFAPRFEHAVGQRPAPVPVAENLALAADFRVQLEPVDVPGGRFDGDVQDGRGGLPTVEEQFDPGLSQIGEQCRKSGEQGITGHLEFAGAGRLAKRRFAEVPKENFQQGGLPVVIAPEQLPVPLDPGQVPAGRPVALQQGLEQFPGLAGEHPFAEIGPLQNPAQHAAAFGSAASGAGCEKGLIEDFAAFEGPQGRGDLSKYPFGKEGQGLRIEEQRPLPQRDAAE